MAVAAASNALVTATEAMAVLGTGTLTGDDLDNLQRQINSASRRIEDYLGVPTITKYVIEYHYGGCKALFLYNYPTVMVLSIGDPAGNYVVSSDYFAEQEKGKLIHFGRFWVAQTSQGQPTRWEVKQVAGWWAGNRKLTGSAGSGTFAVGNGIYVGASWAAATKKAVVTAVGGTEAAPQLTYCLVGVSDFSVSDVIKQYIFSTTYSGSTYSLGTDGAATCTAAAPADTTDNVPESVKRACYALVSQQREILTPDANSVSVGSLSISYGGGSSAAGSGGVLEMPNDVAAMLGEYRGNIL
jgi:hypothetical protein